jgi:hypothetical protein
MRKIIRALITAAVAAGLTVTANAGPALATGSTWSG